MLAENPDTLPIPETVTIEGKELDDALQYGPTNGLTRIREWLEELQTEVHGRKKGDDWALSMQTGSQDGMFKVSRARWRPLRAGLTQPDIPSLPQLRRSGVARDAAVCWCPATFAVAECGTHRSGLRSLPILG